jgi:dipeptidyl aminopeptidase/acylaminoacyl peptidase
MMSETQVAPYGSWKSPITSELIATRTIGTFPPIFCFGDIALDGTDIYWSELRPAEDGRYAIVRFTAEANKVDVTPLPFNASTGVHEYGGGAFVVADGLVCFSHYDDQRIYCQDPGHEPRPITEDAPLRHADGVIDRSRNRLICVREDHTLEGSEAINALVSVDLDGRDETRLLASGNDFYSSPRLSPDGSQLAWLTWNHPNMPWDGCELWVADVLPEDTLAGNRLVAGSIDESIFQPEWSPDGILHFASDRSGWWNLCRWSEGEAEALCTKDAEFGWTQWLLGLSFYDFVSPNSIVCAYTEDGLWYLATLDTQRGKLDRIDVPYTDIWSVRAESGSAVFVGGSPSEPPSIVRVDLASQEFEVLYRSSDVEVSPAYLSQPQPMQFPTEEGSTAHAFYYAPKNEEYVGPQEELPPLLVISHGGPTFNTWTTLRMDIQYWTSRGIAVLDVNFRGSAGYGRRYRQLLDGQYCVVDVDDCENGARYFAERGEVDGARLAIRGESSGGTTALCALTFRDTFACGACYYGDTDLELAVEETHKYESRYYDRVVGPYPEHRETYIERSPIHHADRISCPIIFFQGLDDMIVRPNQTELMVDAVRRRGVPVAYIPFEGEGHGFRKADSIRRSLDAELYFYSRVFGFELGVPVEPVTIENL